MICQRVDFGRRGPPQPAETPWDRRRSQGLRTCVGRAAAREM